MATTATLYPDLQRFPPGTTVKAYKRSNFTPASGPVSGAPQGTQDASATVSAAGQVAFTGLTTSTEYLLYASVSGEDRYARFSTRDTPTVGSSPPFLTSDITGLDAALAAKAALASPALTGTPTVPTAAQGTNTTQAASTQYVQTESGLLVPKSLVDAKGDLLVGTADNTVARKAVGSNGQVLAADSTQTDGLRWRSSDVGVRPAMDTAHSLFGWAFDPVLAFGATSTNPSPSNNWLVLVKLAIFADATIANLVYGINTAGSGFNAGQNLVGIYADGAGNQDLLGKSADQATNWATPALYTAALTAEVGKSLAVKAGDFVWAAFNISATVAPKFDGLIPAGGAWSHIQSEVWRSSRGAAGQTTLPSTLAVRGGINSNNTCIWCGVS